MKTLLRVELKKILPNRIFWLTLGLYFLTFIGVILIIKGVINNVNDVSSNATGFEVLPTNIFGFPEVYHNLGFIAKYVKILMAIVAVILVTNEYTYKTLRQNIITGISRADIVIAKIYVAFGLSLLAAVVLFLFSFVSGIIATDYMYGWKIVDKLYIIPLYFLMVFSYISLGMLFAFLLRKTGLTLISLIFYSYILEPILAWALRDSIGGYLPIHQMNKLIPIPDNDFAEVMRINMKEPQPIESVLLLVIIYTGVFYFLSYLLVKKRDL